MAAPVPAPGVTARNGDGPARSGARRAVAVSRPADAADQPARSGSYELIGNETVASDVKHVAVVPEPQLPLE